MELDRKIYDERLAFEASAEFKIGKLYAQQYNERIRLLKQKRDEKLNKAQCFHIPSPFHFESSLVKSHEINYINF